MTKQEQLLADAVAGIKYHNMRSIRCEKLSDDSILVNGKLVYRDMDGNWHGSGLDVSEAKYFNIFLQTSERLSGKLQVAAYKI